MTKRCVAALLVAACGGERAQPAPTTTSGSQTVRDAAIDATVADAPFSLVYRCNVRMQFGYLGVRIDADARTGFVNSIPFGDAMPRFIHVVAQESGRELKLLFDRYDAIDHSWRGKRPLRPAAEKLRKGTSIVARLVTVAPGMAHLYVDGEVDWTTTGDDLIIHNGYAECPETPQ